MIAALSEGEAETAIGLGGLIKVVAGVDDDVIEGRYGKRHAIPHLIV